MSEEKKYQKLNDFIAGCGYDFSLNVKKGSCVKYPLYVDEELKNTSLDDLNLSQRSSNALKRAGYRTIGEMLEHIKSSADLRAIRNCGEKSVNEIMESLCLYQISLLDSAEQVEYAKKLVELN